jgi:prepilin-type N-terminal cleavage/methylation domain-containing protein
MLPARKSTGFTLVEVLIVLGIIGLLTAIPFADTLKRACERTENLLRVQHTAVRHGLVDVRTGQQWLLHT